MIASLALALQLGAGAPAPSELPVVVPIEIQLEKAVAVIGEPVVFEFTLARDDRAQWTLADSLFTPEQGWLELSREIESSAVGDRIRLTLATLEGGGRSVPALPLVAKNGAEETAILQWSADAASGGAFLAVDHALTEGEDALRPALGLREVEFGPGGRRFVTGLLVSIGLVLALLAGLIIWWVRRSSRRRRGQGTGVVSATGLERLAELSATNDVAVARAQAFETTRLLREVIDERAGEVRSGATDAEWIRGLDEGLATEAQRAELAQLFAAAETVKYGGATQTTFAQDELLVRARRLAREISARPETVSQQPVGAA